MAKTGDIDPDLTLVLVERDASEEGPLPMPLSAVEVDIELVHEGLERTIEYWAVMGCRNRPKTLCPEALAAHQKVDRGIIDLILTALEAKERIVALKAPKEKVVRMA